MWMSGTRGRRVRRWSVAFLAATVVIGVTLVGATAAQAAPVSPPPSAVPRVTTVEITSPVIVDYGSTIDLAARVVDSAGDPAAGTVQFTVQGSPFFTDIELIDGRAHVAFAAVDNGTTVLPYYWGEPTLVVGAAFTPADGAALTPSSTSAEITIRPAPTTTSVSVTAELPPDVAYPLPVTATVGHVPLTGGAHLPKVVAGTVDFYIDGMLSATSAVQSTIGDQQGTATAMLTLPRPGAVSLTAVYSGSDAWAASTSAAVTITVARASASPSPAPAPVKTAPRPTTIPAPPRPAAPAPAPAETAVEAPPASSPVAISATPVADVGPVRGLVLTGLVAALLLLAAAGALITIRLRRR